MMGLNNIDDEMFFVKTNPSYCTRLERNELRRKS